MKTHEQFILAMQNEKNRLRDEFAIAALPALIAQGYDAGAAIVARLCYEIADAMLKEREKWNNQ